MLILLDENLPHRLRHELVGHEVRTTAYQGWAGLKNGALLRVAAEAGFGVIVTADRSIEYQQNRTGQRVAMVVLNGNGKSLILANVGQILAAIDDVEPGEIVRVVLEE